MKVLCINKNASSDPEVTLPIEGNEYNAHICPCGWKHGSYVIEGLEKAKNGATCCYDSRCFIPISEIDEMELLEQREALLQSL